MFWGVGGGGWIQGAKVEASETEAGAQFGRSGSISRSRAIVGALAEGTGGIFVGAAYVFERHGAGSWIQVHKIQAGDKEANDFFGGSVSLDGDRVIVGASSEDNGGANAGAA